jgi:hypothetical protein
MSTSTTANPFDTEDRKEIDAVVFAESDSDDENDVVRALEQVKQREQQQQQLDEVVVQAHTSATTKQPLVMRSEPVAVETTLKLGRWVFTSILCAVAAVSMVICLANSSEGWVEGLFMSQDKNHDTVAVTCGWNTCEAKLQDIYLRPPAFSNFIALMGSLQIVSDFLFILCISYSFFTHKMTRKQKYFKPVWAMISLLGSFAWAIFVLPLMVYINTRDMFAVLGGSTPVYFICMLVHGLMAHLAN